MAINDYRSFYSSLNSVYWGWPCTPSNGCMGFINLYKARNDSTFFTCQVFVFRCRFMFQWSFTDVYSCTMIGVQLWSLFWNSLHVSHYFSLTFQYEAPMLVCLGSNKHVTLILHTQTTQLSWRCWLRPPHFHTFVHSDTMIWLNLICSWGVMV